VFKISWVQLTQPQGLGEEGFGWEVGFSDENAVGLTVGFKVGLCVGADVGMWLGLKLGMRVGVAVGVAGLHIKGSHAGPQGPSGNSS